MNKKEFNIRKFLDIQINVFVLIYDADGRTQTLVYTINFEYLCIHLVMLYILFFLFYNRMTNNIQAGTELLQTYANIERFKMNIISMYTIMAYNDPKFIYGYFLNVKMEKRALAMSYADLRWMSKEYYEFKDLSRFFDRFYEIIGDKEEEKKLLEAVKYFSRFKTVKELAEYEGSMTLEEFTKNYKGMVEEIFEKFGL